MGAEVRRKSSSRLPSRNSMMLFCTLVWMGIFLDTLESLSPTSLRFSVPIGRSSTSLLSTSTDTTITLPSFAADQEETYPSPLHHLHVRSLLSDEEVNRALDIAIDFAEATSRFDSPDSDRHVSYATCDFPVDECDELETFLESSGFEERLFGKFSELYGVDADDLSFDDLFVAYYQAKGEDVEDENSNIMDRLELHRDGSLFSFSLLLNPPDEFDGGGTFYDALRDVNPSDHDVLYEGGAIRPKRAGDAVLHCGKILHGANVVTSGRRVVLVGFVDLAKRCVRKGVLGNACKEFGRQDVARYRLARQERNNHKGGVLTNSRWLSKNSSAIRGFVPASSGIVRRADVEGCRLRRLKAEDTLLRTILLLPEERGPKEDHQFPFEGFEDISFLPDGFEDVSFLPEVVEE